MKVSSQDHKQKIYSPAVGFPWEDITTSVVWSGELPSPGGAVEDAARRARTWLLRSRGFGELGIAIETLS